MGNSSTPERSFLGFQDAVTKYFKFIETQYGFSCIFSHPYCVKFISDKVYLNVYHERISYEIYFNIGLLPEDYNNTLKTDTGDIVMNSVSVSDRSFYQASNKHAVNVVVEDLANLVKKYGNDALTGSINYFESISDKRKERQQKALFLEELRQVEEKAKKAWSSEHYNEVVKVYRPYEKHLNAVQAKRLDYARKMLSSNARN